jgi:hypothetical protein
MPKASFPRRTLTGNLMMTEITSGLEALLGCTREGGESAMNMSKTTEVLQGPDESPSQFYEQICEAFCQKPEDD